MPSGCVGLAVYAGDAAVTATSRQPTLVISHLETDTDYSTGHGDWRMAIGVSMITAVFFIKTANLIENRKVQASIASWEDSLVSRFQLGMLG
jgi:hypothetical protein